jgi:ketosteroid isomerase-like protein
MSQENVERTHRGMSSADEFFGLLHDDVVFDNETYPLPDRMGTYRGKDAVIRVFKDYWRSFSDYSVELTEAIDADDQIVLVMRERATGGASGAVVERAFFAVWAFEDGKIVRIEGRATREEALAAVGLSE